MIQAIKCGLKLITQLEFVTTLQSHHLYLSLVSYQKKVYRDSADSGKLKLPSGDALSEILALPCPVPRTKGKSKAALNAKAVCITDDTVLEDLKRNEVEKAEAKKEKEVKRIERERKKKIREEKQLERGRKKVVREEKQLKKKRAVSNGRKTRSKKNSTQEKGIDDVIAALHLLSSSSDEDGDSSQGDSGDDDHSSQEDSGEENTTCLKCGIRYSDSSEKWICCDGCGTWYSKKCTNIKTRVPKMFYCEKCVI